MFKYSNIDLKHKQNKFQPKPTKKRKSARNKKSAFIKSCS